jgi:flap endonuclease-1
MGIKNLNNSIKKFIKSDIKKIHMSDIENSIIGIDLSIFLYRFIYNKSNPIECFLRQIMLCLSHNILPVYVLDGKAPDEKKTTIEKRNFKRDKIVENIMLLESKLIAETDINQKAEYQKTIERLKKKCVFFSDELLHKITTFFDLVGIPYIRDENESDWLLANLSKEKLIDYVLSEDTDMLAFGAKKILRNFSIREGSFLIYDLEKILSEMEIDQEQLVDICILCGCDYVKKISGCNCHRSIHHIKKYKTIENFLLNEKINDNSIDLNKIESTRKIFLRKMDMKKIQIYQDKIIKNNTNYIELEKFLLHNLEQHKKQLIITFSDTCKKFMHYKIKKSSALEKFWNK